MAHAIESISIRQGCKQRKAALIFVVVFFFVYGFSYSQVNAYPKVVSVMDGVVVPLFVALSIFWCAIEKRIKGEVLGFWWSFGLFFAAPIFLLVFFFKERGVQGGFVFTARVIAFNALMIFIAAIGSILGKYAVAT